MVSRSAADHRAGPQGACPERSIAETIARAPLAGGTSSPDPTVAPASGPLDYFQYAPSAADVLTP
jgi:hypothetical protein